MNKKFNEETIWKAAQEGDLEKVKRWIENGKSVDAKDDDERTPIHWAASNGKENIVDFLLEKGANPDSVDDSEWSPLLSACSSGHTNIVKKLLAHKVDVNRANDTGRTPLFYACSKANVDIVTELLQHGAKVNVADTYGNTPLHRACSVSSANETGAKSAIKIVELLLATKSIRNIDARNKLGETPLMVACLENHHRIALMLVELGADVEVENEDKKNSLELCSEELREKIIPVARAKKTASV